MSDGPNYTIKEFIAAIKDLKNPTPKSDFSEQPGGYAGFKEQWIRWLDEYLTAGLYNRQNVVDNAEAAYQHLSNAGMIIWLNEAAGEDTRIIEAAIIATQERFPAQTGAKYARRVLPWQNLAARLFE
jgi:hypothetical protein